MLSSKEKIELVLLHAQGLSQREAAVEFHRRHLDKPQPAFQTVGRLYKKLQETGSVHDRQRTGRPRSSTGARNAELVLARVAGSPERSSRKIAQELNLSHQSVLRVLQRNRFHPYKIQIVQKLELGDDDRRIEFCNWFETKIQENPALPQSILFSDEATFHLSGRVNRHNCVYWAEENPHIAVEGHLQNDPKVNVWCGIHDFKIIGPVFLTQNLTGATYLEMLETVLPPYLDDLTLDKRRVFCFQQDGAPPHFAVIVRKWLNDHFRCNWIGRGGPTAWPARSPDLTPLDFFLWGYIKSKVYANRPRNIEELKFNIASIARSISTEMLKNVYESIRYRAYLCKQMQGGHFEHLF